jgi:hypothetical protein
VLNAVPQNPTPVPTPVVPVKPRDFQERVDYAAKALKRGTWGRRFEACFEETDAAHVAAVLIRRSERNPELRKAIKAAFQVTRWADVPWTQDMARFKGMASREIGLDAERVREEADQIMRDGLIANFGQNQDMRRTHQDSSSNIP